MFRSYGVGLTLRIPIFDGLDKTYKIKKAMIDIENKRLAWEDARKNLQTQYLNAVNDLMNNQRNFKNRRITTCLPKMCTQSLPTVTGKALLL